MESNNCMSCQWFSFKDILLLIVPVGWTVFSMIAGIAYAAVSRLIPALSAFVSMMLSLFLFVDLWFHHSHAKYILIDNGQKRKRVRDTLWLVQVVFAVFILVVCLIFTYTFVMEAVFSDVTTLADAFWTGFASIFGIIWLLDLFLMTTKPKKSGGNYDEESVTVSSYDVDIEETETTMSVIDINSSSD
eukprot:TRINITY_DN6193_c0_g1_i1.p1 TRINITY_DN6193_c0_g1~~TRINITY_DN6193_c0_g1_i1.p1  ORF type:complete len:188 (+),score=37.61 TRINITY_DN6193_c0_g1_i1:24-587(+)